MSKATPVLLIGLAITLAIAACGDSADGGRSIGADALVVVQETNLGSCSEPHWYERSVTRDCDGENLTILVCSAQPLCEEQLGDLLSPQRSCHEDRTLYMTETTVDCDGQPEALRLP